MRSPLRIHLLAVTGLLLAAAVPASSAGFVDAGRVETSFAATAPSSLVFAGVDAGDDFSIGWTADGGLYSWGDNALGQLGLGDTVSRDEPTRIAMPGGVSVSSASAGVDGSIALTNTGDVYTWGDSEYAPSGSLPGLIPALSGQDVVGVSAGGFYFLAWTADGRLFSWGNNGGGRLGRPGTGVLLDPGQVTAQGLSGQFVNTAAAGRHFGTALIGGGTTVLGWGSFFNATNGVTFSGLPVDTTIDGINAGDAFVFAWTADGRLYSCDGTFVFAQNSALAGVAIHHADVSLPQSGPSSFFAWGEDDVLYAWGLNSSGQLGLGDSTDRADPTPVPLEDAAKVLDVAEGSAHTLLVRTDGTFAAAGTNSTGQLGTHDTVGRDTFSTPIIIYRWP